MLKPVGCALQRRREDRITLDQNPHSPFSLEMQGFVWKIVSRLQRQFLTAKSQPLCLGWGCASGSAQSRGERFRFSIIIQMIFEFENIVSNWRFLRTEYYLCSDSGEKS